jgi:hypothetical protein
MWPNPTTVRPDNAVAACTRGVYRVTMMPQRPRRRVPRRGVGLLLLLLAAAAGIALLVRPAAAGVPLDPNIPHEQALIDAGLSSTPGLDQPTAPIAVDRVLVDGAATYVQYHMVAPRSTPSDPLPTLVDDQGVPVTGDAYSGVSSPSDWTLPVPLPAWVPWHPAPIQRGYIILAPLPATARAAVLQFGAPGGPPSPGAGETIRVPLGPRSIMLRRVAYLRVTARAAGLTLALRDLGVAHVTYTYAPRGGPSSPRGLSSYGLNGGHDPTAPLLVAAGRAVPAAVLSTVCTTSADGLRCAITVVFPPQPPGARLTLTIRAVQVSSPFARITQRPLQGLWRLPFTVP